MATADESGELFRANMQLNDLEFDLQRLYLRSMPRHVTIVLGNGCNISCRHCYQVKNDDHLFRNPKIAFELRKEFSGLYPYVSTIRFLGGEVLALDGFRELIDDVAACVNRPVISISTNGTLLNEEWAERMVRTPFQEVTFSIDGGCAATYERLRRGARFNNVIGNLWKLQEIKKRQKSPFPYLNVFYVVMRSNYREIPQFLELMKSLDIEAVAFQTILIDDRNLLREPSLSQETMDSSEDVERLRDILQEVIAHQAGNFRRMSWSGLRSLFERHGFDHSFLKEEAHSLYPGKEKSKETDVSPAAETAAQECSTATGKLELCPNPWSLILVAENGDVSICFMSEPVGNLFEMPLVEIWNNPKAIAKRSEMIAGRYLSSGCSSLWCGWREGKPCVSDDAETWRKKLEMFKSIVQQMRKEMAPPDSPEAAGSLNAIRSLLKARSDRVQELEAATADLWEKNAHLHDAGQAHIHHLESLNDANQAHIRHLESLNESLKDASQAHIRHLESLNEELRRMVHANPIVRAISILSMYLKRLFRK